MLTGYWPQTVIAQLIPRILDNQQAGGDAQGQAEDVDKGEDLVFKEVSQGDQEEVGDHKRFL